MGHLESRAEDILLGFAVRREGYGSLNPPGFHAGEGPVFPGKSCKKNHVEDLDNIFQWCHITGVEWLVEYTDEFETWWDTLGEPVQEDIDAKVRLLEARGPALGRPHSDTIRGSKHANMKELIIQHAGEPYRVLYAFDPRRCAILLLGGCKTGQKNWYEKHIPVADRLFDEHLLAVEREAQEWEVD